MNCNPMNSSLESRLRFNSLVCSAGPMDGLPCGSWYPKQTASQSSGSSDLWKAFVRGVTLTACSNMFQSRKPFFSSFITCSQHATKCVVRNRCFSLAWNATKQAWFIPFKQALKSHHLQSFWSRTFLVDTLKTDVSSALASEVGKLTFHYEQSDDIRCKHKFCLWNSHFKSVQSPVTWQLPGVAQPASQV